MKIFPRKYTRTSVQIMVACIVAIVIVLAALVIGGCVAKIEPEYNSIMPGTDIEVDSIELRFRKPEELQRQYAGAGQTVPEKYELRAFIARDLDTGKKIIYSPPPKHVDDDVTCSIGHEFLHAALGNYHDEPRR